VKTELMPDFDYEEFDRRQAEWEAQNRDFEDESGAMENEEETHDEIEALNEVEDVEDKKEETKKKDEDEDDVTW